MSSSLSAIHCVLLLVWSVVGSVGRIYGMASGDEERNLYPSGESRDSMLVEQETEHGYSYKFVSQVDPMYECPICLLVLRNPVQTECGHRFCHACIMRWKQQPGAKCPSCGESLETQSVFPDNFAKRFISNFKVKCVNEGCSEEVELGKIKNHLESCVFCQVPCPNKCGRLINKLHLDEHLNSECENRYIKCEICGEEILYIEKQPHQSSLCPKLNVTCQYCKQEMKKCELMKHCEEDCKKIPISCKYKSLGCEHQIPREDIDEHRKVSLQDHMDLLLDELKTLSSEFYSFRETNFLQERKRNDTGPLSSSLYQQQALSQFSSPEFRRLLRADEKTFYSDPSVVSHLGIPFEKRFAELSMGGEEYGLSGPTEPQSLQHEFHRMKSSLAEKTVALEDSAARIGKLENKIEEQARLLRDISTKMTEMESRFCQGCYIWKVTNYRKLRQEAVSGSNTVLHSPGFYSSLYGYRLCIRLNLNGVDSATGRHLSLFVHFMKGDYDDLLPWPFRGKITLSILDQNEYMEQRQHLSEVLVAKPRLAAFQKPVTQRNHKGFGYMEYAPIALIETSPYVMHDTLFIRALVEHDMDLMHERPF